jgi:hypothetical protein
MNEFRKFLGLKRPFNLPSVRHPSVTDNAPDIEFETFEEWNPDPEIAV